MPSRPRDPQAVRQLRHQFQESIAEGRLNIAEAVKHMRKISGLTQEQFAKNRGMSLLTLKRIESGTGNPTVETLNRVGGIFGLKVAFVHDRPSDPSTIPGPDVGSVMNVKKRSK
jgi:DNA-binding XRE family transcriptional regulator